MTDKNAKDLGARIAVIVPCYNEEAAIAASSL